MKLTTSLCLLAFATMLSYAVAGSAAQSMFLSAFGADKLPYAWLGVAGMSVIATSWVNALSERYDIVRLFSIGCAASVASLVGILLIALYSPKLASFLIYVWKDIYIIVLVELFWTLANIVFGISSASRSYGLFCAAGSLGGVCGSLLLARFADALGLQASLWTLVPLLLAIAIGCRRLVRHTPVPEPKPRRGVGLGHGLATLRQSFILPAMLLVVALAQGFLTLLDFRYSAFVEAACVDSGSPTAIISNVNALINAISFVLQMATGFIMRTLGGAVTLSLMPVLGLVSLVAVSLTPHSLWTICVAQMCGKSLDYSLFRASKEMIYIPLSYAEKTQGKAMIDILVYRVAKGLVSATLLAVASVGLAERASFGLLWAVGIAWTLAVLWLLARMRRHPGLQVRFFSADRLRRDGSTLQ